MPQWLVDILGEDLAPIGRVALAALVVILLAMLMIWLAKKAFGGMTMGARGRQAPRLAVADILAVDDKRRLILVRRDETEHLVLVGGANDLLLEAGIRQDAESAVFAPRREPSLTPAPFASDRFVEDREDDEPAFRLPPERVAPPAPPPPAPPPVRVEADRREGAITPSLAQALAAAAGDEDRPPARDAERDEEEATKTRRELEAALMAARASMPDLSAPSRATPVVPPAQTPPAPERNLAENDGGAVPDEPAETARRPLSVRSFATAIQNRKPSFPQPAPAPAPAAPQAAEPPRPAPQPIPVPINPPAPAAVPIARPAPSQAPPVAPPPPAPAARPAAAILPPAPQLPSQPATSPAPPVAAPAAPMQLRPPMPVPTRRSVVTPAPVPLPATIEPATMQPPVAPPVVAPVVVASSQPEPDRPRAEAPVPVAPAEPAADAAKPDRREPTLEDFLAAELDMDFRPSEPSPKAAAAPEVRSPVEPARPTEAELPARPVAAVPDDGPSAPRKLTLEEEMERLLGDFSASTSFTTRR
jgi:flagellar protein FliO/FliZ